MSFASLRRVLRSARKGLCSTCAKTKHPQLEAAGAGHVGCLMYTFETLGQVVVDEHDVTAMHVAARKGQISILIYLLENDHVPGVPRAKNGATPAHDAAGTGHLECLEYILSRTLASAQDKDINQATPLHWAVQSGHFKVVQWLVLKANASIDSAASNGVTPFHIAASRNYLDILRWLTAHAYRHYPKPRRLINAKDRNGSTPLYHSAHVGHLQVIQWLAEKGGGDPTIFTSQGLAPIHAATITGHLNCVKYLFRFGSGTAPGGLRSTEGASAMHYAAAEGHVDIIKWLLNQKECTGNERDYYQCTPLHDAAEHGHLKAIQVLCEAEADHLLTDIEGNFPRDLAEKHHHTKCAKYLTNLLKRKTSKLKSENTASTTSRSQPNKSLRRQQKTTTAEMIDSYRNAPPHQRPVNVFEDEEDDEFEAMESNKEWETLHDLMDESELEKLSLPQGGSIYVEDKKRRNLEANMRREAEERLKKKKELQRREQEVENEIRDRFIAEGSLDTEEWIEEGGNSKRGRRRRKSDVPHKIQTDVRRLSLPAKLTSEDITERGIVEKRTWEFESRNPAVGQGARNTLLSKLWPGKKSSSASSGIIHSLSWDGSTTEKLSSSSNSLQVIDASEEYLPIPPPLPTIEYLLGKRPHHLRGKGHSVRHKHAAGKEEVKEEVSDNDSDHSSVSSTHSESRVQHKKKGKKKKKRSSKEGDVFDWQYSQISTLTVPHSSPPREKKMMRKATPPPAHFNPDLLVQNNLSHMLDDVTQQLDMDSLSDSASSLSPLHSPSPIGTPNHVSPSSSLNQIASNINTKASSYPRSKRAAPKPPLHLQNQQAGAQIKMTPISQKGSSRNKASQKQQHQQHSGNSTISSPDIFMAVLNKVISTSPKQPRIMRQYGHQPSPTSGSPVANDINLRVDLKGTMLGNYHQNAGPSPEHERSASDSESSEDTSSSDDSTSSSGDGSSSEESSDDDSGLVRPQVPKRPIMARNISMGSPRHRIGGISRARLMARYPRLLRKKPIRLQTIAEVPEELVHAAETHEEQSLVFHRLLVEKRVTKAWRKYMQIMKTIYRKAEKMAQRKRRDLLARVFYSWVQVRNMGAVEKSDVGIAISYHEKRLLKKTFNAWYFAQFGAKMSIARSTSMQLITAEETYIEWLNEHLPSKQQTVDISESLADGTLIIKAISNASGKKPPKYNTRPKVRLHRQDNWKVAHEFMKSIGVNVKGIEPADLANVTPAAIHNLFNNILRWSESKTNQLTVL